jgi:LacI family transcriptional regulator, galactose operon repressor
MNLRRVARPVGTATIRDVAREANVSVATVSRVMNESGPVRDETRRRIREVAQRLGFSPNHAAQSLSTRRTRTVGVLLPDVHGEFFSELMRGIDQIVQKHGYHVLISSLHSEPSGVELALRALRGRMDGLILMVPDQGLARAAAQLPTRSPVVLLNMDLRSGEYDTLNIDNVGGARAMTEHLLNLGHRQIAMICGPERNGDASDRERGHAEALRATGLAVDPSLQCRGDFTEAGGFRATRELLARGCQFRAIFAANDAMAVGVLSALRDAGQRVPEDVAVAGFDDIPMAQYLRPALSTVRVSIAALGARAAERLFERIRSKTVLEPTHDLLETDLIVRSSCGSPQIFPHPKEAEP